MVLEQQDSTRPATTPLMPHQALAPDAIREPAAGQGRDQDEDADDRGQRAGQAGGLVAVSLKAYIKK